jgi:hypothetical protein
MNFRLTTFFFGLVVILFAALLVVVLLDDEKKGDSDVLGHLFLDRGLSEKDIDEVVLVRTEPSEERLTFGKKNGQWKQLPDGRVDGMAIDGLVRAVLHAKPFAYKELTENLTLHGLDKPTLKVILKAGAGAENELTVNVGLTVIGDPAVTFVTTSTDKRPMAVRRTELAALFRETATRTDGPAYLTAKWLPEYRPRRLLMPLDDVQAVKLGVEGKELALARDKGGAWKFVAPAGYGEADDLGDSAPQTPKAPFTGVRPLLDYLTTLQAGPEDYEQKPGDDLKKFGLDEGNPARFRIELTGKDGQKEVLLLGKIVEEKEKENPLAPKQTRVYAQRDGDRSVIKLITDRTESLRQTIANPGELRNKDALPESRRGQIDALDLTVGAATVKLRRVTTGLGDRWVVYGDGKEPVEAKPGEVETLLSAISRPRVAREVLTTPNDAAFADAEKKATVKAWYGAVVEEPKVDPLKLPPEPKLKPDARPIELVFGKREGETVLVRKVVEGAKTDLKLPDAVLAQVTKSRLDFLDPKLKSFNTQFATKLTFNRGAEVIEVTRATPTAPWKFVSPAALKDKDAEADVVNALVGILAGLAPDRVVAEPPLPDLKPWSLEEKAPRMKATVALNDKTDTERVYHFGADVPDKPLVYAQQVGRPFVVTVPREVLNRFLTDDLRDRIVYKLAPANVTKVTIEGWSALNFQLNGKRERMKYVLEKNASDVWVGTEPAGFALDPEKVPALLAALASPRAVNYLPGKPEHGTDPATNAEAMVFTIASKGGPPVLLVLGKPAEGGKVFASSNVLNGGSFTLDATELRKLTETPAALQKAK